FVSARGRRTSLPGWNVSAGNPPLFSPLLTAHLRRGAVVLSLTLLVAHAAVLQFMANTPRVSVVSNVIQLAVALLAALTFAVVGARAGGFVRRFCLLMAASFTLWSAGQITIMYYMDLLGLQMPGLSRSDVFFFGAYLPLLAAIAMDGRADARRIHWVRTLDLAQVGIVISATYLYFLYFIPLSGLIRQDLLSVTNDAYTVLDMCVAGGFVLRTALTPAGPLRSLFARLTATFLAYCIGSTIYGSVLSAGIISEAGSWFDLSYSVPFVIATVGIATWRPAESSLGLTSPPFRNVVAVWVLPILAPALVMALGYQMFPSQPQLALLIGIASFTCSLVRLLLTQLHQRKALHALRAMERKFSKAFRSAPDSMTISTLEEGRYLAVNDRFLELFGLEREEVIGSTALELGIWVNPEDRTAFVEHLTRHGRVRDREAFFSTRSGNQIQVQISAETVDMGGEPCLVAGVRDITERKRAEDALRRSESRYRDLVQGAAYGIYRTNIEGRILYANPALVKILGYEAVVDLLRLNTGRDVWASTEERARVTQDAMRNGGMVGTEVQWKRKDGTLITVRLSTRQVPDEAGNPVEFESIVEDVTERRLLEEQFRQAQKMEAVGRLAAGVAHDFNNLLTVIQGYTDMALLGLEERHPVREELLEVQNAASRATDLTRQLLAFSRQQALEPKLVDLNAVVENLQKMLGRLLGENIELRTVLSSELGCVHADSGQLEQVIMNLAVNAKDAMPKGGELVVETANVDLDEDYVRRHPGSKPGRYVRLSVRDTGVGMDERTRSRIFEPFFTTKELGKGTGLGLATVYGVVKQSGGYIAVESSIGEGASFDIHLPFVPCAGHESCADARPEGLLQGTETVLLIEDEETLCSLSSDFLRQHGYKVLTAGNGAEAIGILQRHAGKVDLVVTDVVMPEMNGKELANWMGRQRPEIKVLFMSGYTAETLREHGICRLEVPVLSKPFTREALVRRVRSILDGTAARKNPVECLPVQ
ncbi:MAG: PAS domain S-box protein, partial [Terriglobales bacterium]